jgi:predicted enzyme related to lactoylglutathione lyase
MPRSSPLGHFVWHELMTTDTKAAERFYKAVVGWGTAAWGKDASYRVWTTSDGPRGGLTALPNDTKEGGAPPNWLSYIGAPDVDATVRQAMALGARVLTGPLDIPTVGRFAVVADPQGAPFAAIAPKGWQPDGHGDARLGHFSWHDLATTDSEAAFRFYAALFGWERIEALHLAPGQVYQIFGRAGKAFGGIYDERASPAARPHWLGYALVADVERAAAAVLARGGQVVRGPMEVPGGDRIAQCIDPQGAAFAVHAPPGAMPGTQTTKAVKRSATNTKGVKKAAKQSKKKKRAPRR